MTHKAASPYNPLEQQPPDRRISELADKLRTARPPGVTHDLAADSLQGLANQQQALGRAGPPVLGRIIQSYPFLNSYTVQLDGGGGSIVCCSGSHDNFSPMGVRSTSPLAPDNIVVVLQIPGLAYGVIIASVPEPIYDGNLAAPDWIQQASCAGFHREKAFYDAMRIFQNEGMLQNLSDGRPLDSTAYGEKGEFAETGVGWFVDAFQTFIRVSEICGVYCNYLDHYMRLAAWMLDFQTAAFTQSIRQDEGEVLHEEHHCVYPWERVGCYSPEDQRLYATFQNTDVTYDEPVGRLDEPDALSGLFRQEFARTRIYRGYLGQGGRRLLVLPKRQDGLQEYGYDLRPEYAVFDESIGLDGDFTLASAMGITLAKRAMLPVPIRVKLPEDQGENADNKGNYSPSGVPVFGNNTEHKIAQAPEINDADLRVQAGLNARPDMFAYMFNWKAQHAFHYHQKDFRTPEEGDMGSLTDKLDFAALQTGVGMEEPGTVDHFVDHRYGYASYTNRESYYSQRSDGSVQQGCGFGTEIRQADGHIFLDAPGDIYLRAGRSVHIWAGDDVIIKAKNSVDVTATDHDVRLKASKNMEMLSGNSGTGACLIENRATAVARVYKTDQLGEDVVGAGITFRSPRAEIMALGSEVYIRTGGITGDDAIQPGPITLDAARGRQPIITHSSTFDRHIREQAADWFGTEGKKTGANVWNANAANLSSGLQLRGNLAVAGGGVLVEENLTLVNGHVSSFTGGDVGKLVGQSLQLSREAIGITKTIIQDLVTGGTGVYESELDERLYQSGQLGSESLQRELMFSLRDDDGVQYGAEDFKLVEARWQQAARLGIGDEVNFWTEEAVVYQDKQLMPFPGRKRWSEEETLYELESLKLYDAANRHDVNRRQSDGSTTPAYETPVIAEWKKSIPQSHYRTIK